MERRVRTVRLAAANRTLIQRGALLLEDALRTASLPEPPGGRVLIVRTLSLGRIRADRSAASLSLMLERRVRELDGQAVHVEDASAPGAPMVYFRDPLEPFVMLALRLARSQPLDAWFWPLAVPGLRPGMPRDEALRLALAGALRTEPGPVAAILLVAELHARGTLEPLLSSLRWQDGPALVQGWWGLQPPRPEAFLLMDAPGPEQELAAPIRAEVSRWARAWGHGDARSLWLAAVALSVGRPARAADPELPARAWRVLGALHAADQRVSRTLGVKAAGDTPSPLPPSPPSSGPEPASVPRVARTALPPSSAPRQEGRAEGPPAQHEEPPTQPPEVQHTTAERADLPSGASPSSSPRAERPPDLAEPAPRAAELPPVAPEIAAPSPDVSLPTAAGGLLFLIPMLEYLGLRELLAEWPALLDRAFPERFLIHVATRLGVPATDPLLLSLGAANAASLADSCPFSLPARFRERVAAREPFRLLREPAGRRVAFDARGRIPLAVVRPEGAVLPPFEALSAQAVESPVPWDDFSLLLHAFHLGVSRICRTRARLGLRGLVLRRGRLVASRTHLDVIFDHRQSDLSIRRAGLDIDPGWVPWLARVIRYHYLYGESAGD